ncbi:MAG: sodium:solute symporter [Deltaproteobacteria bacterium]|nr:sodium:solute symporter [Deltaproteobacteria bacterium]
MQPPQVYVITELWTAIIIVGGMFALFYLMGWIGLKQTTSTDDLYAAGFKVGALVNGLAMASTWASLATFLGVSALILKLQVPFVYLWLQWALSIPLITLLYGTSMRRMKAYTPCTFIKARYGNPSTIVIACWMILVMVMYALGQLIGLGQTFEILFAVKYETALIISGIVVIGYMVAGGMMGATYNAAFQMVVMTLTMIVPMGWVMKVMGSSGWWMPPLAYGDMVPSMLKMIPTFFDTKYDFRWYFSLIPAFTLGPVALPHLAARVFTSASLKSARWAVVWFLFFLGALFSGTYVVGFAGNFFQATTGIVIKKPDQITLILQLVYSPQWVAAFVLAGAIAAGVSTLNGNLMAIAALAGSDILGIIAPQMDAKKRLRIGFVVLAIGGLVAMILSFNPPTFLVTSILWAFGLLASTATPGILLGVWWKQANKYALLVSSTICGAMFIIISPHVIKSIVIGKGLPAALGMSGGLVTIPLSFSLFIILSIIFNKMGYAPSQEEKAVLDRIHGWNDYREDRYNGKVWPWVVAVVCLVISWWGLQPW